MGTKQKRISGFSKIMKPMNYNPKYLLDRKGNPNGKSYLVEGKEDGLRGFIIVNRSRSLTVATVKAYTSSGVKVLNAKLLCSEIAAKLRLAAKSFTDAYYKIDYLRDGFVLDGEFLCKNWNGSNSAVKTQTYNKLLAKELAFKAWTVIPIADWQRRRCDLDELDRKYLLYTIILALKSKAITATKYTEYATLTDKIVQRDLKVALGFNKEGIVIKECNGLYLFKKCRTWMKLKPYFEADMSIIGAEEECDKHKVPKNSLGAVIVKGVIDGKKIKTRVGGGYKRKDRIELWKMHKQGKLVGKVIEMKHEGVTVNNAVRFPRFKRLRWDKKFAGKNE